MFVRQLEPGQEFRVDLGGGYGCLEYRFIHANECRAYVQPLSTRRRTIASVDGNVLAEFEGSAAGINISSTTECEVIDQELEEMMGTRKTQVTKTATTKTEKGGGSTQRETRGGDRHFDPTKQDRPVRENTIRAKLLAAMESGKTDIPKLMKEFDMARSLFIAHVHEMHKCHGYGYTIKGDVAKIAKPVGGVIANIPSGAKAKETKAPAKFAPAKSKTIVDDDDASDLL